MSHGAYAIEKRKNALSAKVRGLVGDRGREQRHDLISESDPVFRFGDISRTAISEMARLDSE